MIVWSFLLDVPLPTYRYDCKYTVFHF